MAQELASLRSVVGLCFESTATYGPHAGAARFLEPGALAFPERLRFVTSRGRPNEHLNCEFDALLHRNFLLKAAAASFAPGQHGSTMRRDLLFCTFR
jgi:hypothetical protein